MPKIPVTPPIYGVNDDKPFSQQPQGTTRNALNMRAQDPIEKRERLSQRSGLSDITGPAQAQVNGSNKVQHLSKVTFSNQNIDYADITDATMAGTSDWKNSYQGKEARIVEVDRQNNTYWIVGRDLLVKSNSQGEEVWRFTIPLKEATHTIRGMAIDSLSNVWVGSGSTQEFSDSTFTKVTTSDVQENNQLWRISTKVNTDLDEEPEITGEFTTSGFIADIAVSGSFVYYVQNRQDTFEADLVIVAKFGVNSLVTTTDPETLASRGIPYPVNSLAVNSSGEIIISCEPFVNRAENPKYPNLSKVSNANNLPGLWTPHRNLPNAASLYSEHRASLQVQANGTGVAVLLDQTGNSRHFSTTQANASADTRTFIDPIFTERVIGDAPGIRFNGVDSGMATETNLNSEYQDRGGAQRTAWPSYGSFTGAAGSQVADDTSAMFAYFMLVRVVREGAKGAIIGQRSVTPNTPDETVGYLGTNAFAMVANRPQSFAPNVTAVSGKISLFDYVREASGGDFLSDYTPQGSTSGISLIRHPLEGDLNGTRSGAVDAEVKEDPPVALITIMIDNAVEPGAADNTVTRAFWRLNGKPMDRWKGSIRISEERVTLGYSEDLANSLGFLHGEFSGDMVYQACIARIDPTDNTEPKVIAHEFTSRAVSTQFLQVQGTGGTPGGTFNLTFTFPDGTTETSNGHPYTSALATVRTKIIADMASINAEDIVITGTSLFAGALILFGYDISVAKPFAPAQYPTGQYAGLQFPLGAVVSVGNNASSLALSGDIDDGSAAEAIANAYGPGNDLEKMEGWIMHEHGVQHLLEGPYTDSTVIYRHPYSENPPLDDEAVDPTDLLSTNAIIAKYGTGDLSLKWVETGKGGVGFGVELDKDDNLFTVGPSQASPSDDIEYRFITDNGDDVTFGVNAKFNPPGFQDRHVKMDTDEDKNVYVPRYPVVIESDGLLGLASGLAIAQFGEFIRTTGSWVTDGYTIGESVRAAGFPNSATNADWVISTVTALILTVTDTNDDIIAEVAAVGQQVTRLDSNTAKVYDAAGAEEVSYESSVTADQVVGAYCAASPIARPDYGPASTIVRDEFMFLGTNQTPPSGGTVDADTARKVRIVSKTPNASSPRDTRLYAVANGGIRLYDGANSFVTIGTAETGDDVLAAASTYFSSTELFGKIYLSDGVNPMRVINPFEVPLATGQVATHKAADGGEVPICRLTFSWRGRLGFAHQPDNPHYWKLAEIGRPENLNEFPPESFVGQAISGLNAPEAGESPDIINTVVTGSGDYLLFGGDHSITALVGDPTSSGLIARGDLSQSIGQFQTISDSTGMAFGKPWARDKMDTIFFYSSRGEAFALRPGGKPESISDRAIEKRLQQVDFSTHYVDAQWNWEDNTVHFFVIPFGSATAETHHIFDVQRGKLMQVEGGDAIAVGWWPDKFGHADVQPTAVTVFDGDDPNDRTLLVGCADGRVRKWDPNANNDGENGKRERVKVDAFVDYGPLAPVQADGEYMFTALEVDLDRNQSGALVEYLRADTGDFPQVADPTGIELEAGYNPPLHERVAGGYCGFRIRNSAVDQRFSIDRAMIDASPMGDRRTRT